jgi:hypothetical protein
MAGEIYEPIRHVLKDESGEVEHMSNFKNPPLHKNPSFLSRLWERRHSCVLQRKGMHS